MTSRLTVGRCDIGANAAFITLGLFGLWEGYRLGAGWGDTGPQAGFFPFVLSALMLLGGLWAAIQAWVTADPRPYFEDPQEIKDLLKVGIPIVLAIAAVPWLGVYLMSGIYLFLFALWYGRHPWWLALGVGVAFPVLMFFALQVGFHISMPRSIWARSGLVPF